ncbi:MAG: hypothetical protein NE328_24770 [Lentisphaeraceae bacterium]|nr:hypothetical protein [Lentisphaeraceae bacterium]
MARTHSRKISRRTIKKKSPIPAVLVVLYMAGLAICYVIIQIQNKELSYSLDTNKKEAVETRNRIRNLNAEVEKYTAKKFIDGKIRQFNLGLREPEASIKQVYQVTHFDQSDGDLAPQTLKQENKVETVTKR